MLTSSMQRLIWFFLDSSTSDYDGRQWLVNDGSGNAGRERSVVRRRRTRSARDLARRESRRRSSPSSVEHRHDGRRLGTGGRRATSGSPRGRKRASCDSARAASSKRSVNRLSTQQSSSLDNLRRVALAVRQLANIGKCYHLLGGG